VDPDQLQWQQTQAHFQATAQRVLDDSYSMLIRAACIDHGLSVQDPQRNSNNNSRSGSHLYHLHGSSDARAPVRASRSGAGAMPNMGRHDPAFMEDILSSNSSSDEIMSDGVNEGMNPEDLY
jgi:hypothetical protein